MAVAKIVVKLSTLLRLEQFVVIYSCLLIIALGILGIGIILILTAVILIVAGKSLPTQHFTFVFSKIGHVLKKKWRWKS